MGEERAQEDEQPTSLDDRLDLLERRLKRVIAERNKARGDFARLAKVAAPFGAQTSRSMRKWLDETPPEAVFRLSQGIDQAINGESHHQLVVQVIQLAETLAKAVEQRRAGESTDFSPEYYADKVLNKLNKLHAWD